MRLDLTQEGTFGCTRFFVAVLASPRKGHITALTPPRRGRTATLAPPHKGRATALAPSRREHANTAVKDEPQRWSCTKLPRRQESQSSHTKDESKKRGNICPLCMIGGIRTGKGRLDGKISARYIPKRRFAGHFEYMENISCQNQLILDAWRQYLATRGRFFCPRPLRECIATKYCHDLPPRMHYG